MASKFEYGSIVAGVQRATQSHTFQTTNPAIPGEVVGVYRAAGAEEVADAVASAQAAQREWGRVPGLERQARIEEFLARLKSNIAEIAEAIMLEMGKPLSDARGEIEWSLLEARYMVAECARSVGEIMPSRRPAMRNMVLRRPRGVIAAISPWNYPFLTPMRKIVPALVYGNSIVLKPSEFSPATACKIAEAAEGILPAGLLNVVLGEAKTAQALVSDRRVNGITFTGSVPTGRKIAEAASRNLAEVSLELGGKNALVLVDTDNLDRCLDEILAGAIANAGQRCTAVSRVLVQRDLVAKVEQGLAQRMNAVKVGPGTDAATQMGPVAHDAHYRKIQSMIELACEQGANLLAGGAASSASDDGLYIRPTLLKVTPDMSAAREEIFGPVLSLIEFDTVDEALSLVNDVDFGLAASLFSNDNRVIQRFVDECDAGMLHVNIQTSTDPNMPFVGMKDSGVGAASVGRSASAFYTTEHSVYLRYDD